MQTEQSEVRVKFIEWVLSLSDAECRAALLVIQLVRDAVQPALLPSSN